jgi:UDP-N-acetylmuramoyl-tripeptide--D-alanyl-D-alanine ligase
VPGIIKTVDLELTDRYKYFICEMGAHKRGDIREICEMVDPGLAIITGINEQHLERFGSIENTILAKWELAEYVLKKHGLVAANFGNMLVKEKAGMMEGITGYGEGITDPREQNLAGAKVMAKLLEMTDKEIKAAIKNLETPDHRLKIVREGEMTIIDDAYSSNPDGFIAAMNFLKKFDGKKIVITPGIVELGDKTREIHARLGQVLATTADYVLLVRKNERTQALEKSLKPGTYKYIDRLSVWSERVNTLRKNKGWGKAAVLFENDLTDNY